MALINCPECNKQISDTIKSCPNCGYELKKRKKKSNGLIKDFFIIVGLLEFAVFLAIHKNIYLLIGSILVTFLIYGLLMGILDYLKEWF